jgi:hypothetical protein
MDVNGGNSTSPLPQPVRLVGDVTRDRTAIRARAEALVEDWIPGELRLGGAKRVLVDAVADGLRWLSEEDLAHVVADWLELRPPSSWRLRGLIDAALKGDQP